MLDAVLKDDFKRVKKYSSKELKQCKTWYGNSLIYAARSREMIQLLKRRGLDVDAKDAFKATALFHAKDEEKVEALILEGANVHHRDAVGHTALHYVMYNGGVPGSVVRLHVNAGADLESLTEAGKRPIDYCFTHLSAFKELIESGSALPKITIWPAVCHRAFAAQILMTLINA